MTPDISIVVCTQNRAAMLRDALASLFDLATDGEFTYEIVVVDNASSDETPAVIAEAAGRARYPLRGVFEGTKGIVAARNRGIAEAAGRWIAFFDDDQLADPRWLAELFRGAKERSARVVGGSVRLALSEEVVRELHPTVRMLLGEALHTTVPTPYGGRLTPGCGNLMIERSVFDEVGVFERTISGRGEDTDLFSRIEAACIPSWYLPQAVIDHLTPPARLAPEYLLKLAKNVGRSVAERQRGLYSPRRFALLRCAKALRLALWQVPAFALASLLRQRQRALGLRCQIEINKAFLAGREPQTAANRQSAARTLRLPSPHPLH